MTTLYPVPFSQQSGFYPMGLSRPFLTVPVSILDSIGRLS